MGPSVVVTNAPPFLQIGSLAHLSGGGGRGGGSARAPIGNGRDEAEAEALAVCHRLRCVDREAAAWLPG